MFYKNKALLKTALSLIINNTDNMTLVNNISASFEFVDTKTIPDVEIRELCETVKTISQNIREKGIRTPETAKEYIATSSLPDNIKKLLLSLNTRYSEELVKDYNYLFTKSKYMPIMEGIIDKLQDRFDTFKKSGIESVREDLNKVLDITKEYDDVMKEVSSTVLEQELFVFDVSKDDNKSTGVDKLERLITTSQSNRIKTGCWFDNLTGGGFETQALYIVTSIAGGFKSGFLQNVTERIASHMKPSDFLVETGVTPCIYYLNLEMSLRDLYDRKLKFYGHSLDDVLIQMDQDPSKGLEYYTSQILRDNNALLPVIYEKGKDQEYDIIAIRNKMRDIERLGYKITCLIVDYADLIKYEVTQKDLAELRSPLVSKAYLLRDLAIEFDIPVITGAQLNRDGEREVKQNEHRTDTEDIVTRLSSSQLSKAIALKTIPEQIYCCYISKASDGKDYFSIIVDKDRNGKAKFIENPNRVKNETQKKFNKKSKYTPRVLYVAPVESFRISDDYAGTIRDFVAGSADVFDEMDIDSINVN